MGQVTGCSCGRIPCVVPWKAVAVRIATTMRKVLLLFGQQDDITVLTLTFVAVAGLQV